MNTEYTVGSFYWIKIKQWDDGSQHAIRIADKWSAAKWDGDCFEELNEMYRIQDVVEIGPMIPLPDQLKQRDGTINELKAALGEMIPIVQDVFDKITIDDTDTHRAYLKFKSALENAYKRIED